jgi:hypothetical protein
VIWDLSVKPIDAEHCDEDPASDVGIDAGPEPSRLPRRETAARDLSRGSVASLPGKLQFRMSVQ